MKYRQITGDAFILIVAVFTIYLSAVMVRRIRSVVLKDSYRTIFRYELAACAVFLLLALDVRFGLLVKPEPVFLKAAGWTLRVLAVLAAAVLLFLAVRIAAGSRIRTDGPAQYAIVLGLALENGMPAGDLLARLDAAEQYARNHPDAVLILTGGNPDGSGKTEAAVMRGLLAGRGLAENRMILEDRAETTRANFRNTARMIDPDRPVVLISSDYHMDRAVRTARGAGFSHVLRMPAKSSFGAFGANVMWEVILELNELTLKRE